MARERNRGPSQIFFSACAKLAPMLKRLARAASWFLGGALVLALIGYAVLYVANLEDRLPAAEIAAFKRLQERASPIIGRGNSYLFILGFAGPPESDPMSLGIQRYEWMDRASPEFDRADDPLGEEYNVRALRSKTVAELADTCSESELQCLRLLESEGETVERWLADERWLLDRYRALLSMGEFREAIPFEVLAPLPSYSVVFEGQRLHIADAWRSATEIDAAGVSAALDRDLSYWRMVLRNSDALITKMIATAAIIRHFKLGNIVLRRLPQEVAADGIPASWRAAISDEERSMTRTLAGEWAYVDESTKRIKANSENAFGDSLGLTAVAVWDQVMWALLEPFWQPQDLSNRHARLMRDISDAFNVPYEEIPRAVHTADDLQSSAFRPFSRLHNFTGDLVMGISQWGFSDYAVRVSDLEGIRRVALVVADLRAAGASKGDMVQRMIASESLDPYSKAPFTWLESEDAAVFQGLESHKDRSEHKIIF